MASKETRLKKRLIRDGIIIFVILVIVGGGSWMLSSYDDDVQSDKQSKANQLGAQRAEYSATETLLKDGAEVGAYYNAYTQTHNPDFVLNRDTATQLFAELREKNHLGSLSIAISHITDAGEVLPLKTGTLVKSDVTLTFTALTDSSVYNFIKDLHQRLQGIAVVYDLKLNRTGDLTRNVLVDLSQHRITPMVNGEISFLWLGIHAKPEEKADDKAPDTPGFTPRKMIGAPGNAP